MRSPPRIGVRHLGRANRPDRLEQRAALIGEILAAGADLALVAAARAGAERRQKVALAFLDHDHAYGDVGARAHLARHEQLHRGVARRRFGDALADLIESRYRAVHRQRGCGSQEPNANANTKKYAKKRSVEHSGPPACTPDEIGIHRVECHGARVFFHRRSVRARSSGSVLLWIILWYFQKPQMSRVTTDPAATYARICCVESGK